MDKDAKGIIYALLGLAGLCIVAITALDVLDRTNSEVLTIFGTTLATIVGAVAGVVVGQREAYKVEPRKVEVEERPLTGPDTGARADTAKPLQAETVIVPDLDAMFGATPKDQP